jgi:thioredoxin-related protein
VSSSTPRWSRRLEIASNISIVIVSALLAITLVQNWNKSRDRHRNGQPEVALGDHISLSGVTWTSRRQTLVLVLSVGCHFCSESAPFYRAVAKQAAEREIQFVAVLPQDVRDSTTYLQALGIRADHVCQTPLDKMKVRGTPTILLVDDQGAVVKLWRGRLAPDVEREVLGALNASAPRPPAVS